MSDTNSNNQKSYYAVIPANVRYDEHLTPNSKLLYGEITALCNEKGYCWASNNYFANLYKCTPQAISKRINQLLKRGYVKIEMIRKGNIIIERRIFLSESINQGVIRYQPEVEGVSTKSEEGYQQKVKENIKYNNTINKQPKSTFDEKSFSEFWDTYGKKIAKEKCMSYWIKIKPELYPVIIAHVKEYVKSKPDKQYRKNPDTYLYNKCWNDEIITHEEKSSYRTLVK